ncbi:hypothetical protein [Salininema proteolyticum]|uniref:Uncharacterized protein n=1 Tax=Salininema proteolyticum TaxID=1607685 RepID=A0ABV8U3R5_9ACTN
MPVVYLPSDTTDLGTITHDEQTFHAHLDQRSKTVFLLLPDEDDRPTRQRPPAVIANCNPWPEPKLVIYTDALYQQSLLVSNWTTDLADKIAHTVRPWLS